MPCASSERLGFGFVFRNPTVDMMKPDMQKAHWKPCSSMMACCTGSSGPCALACPWSLPNFRDRHAASDDSLDQAPSGERVGVQWLSLRAVCHSGCLQRAIRIQASTKQRSSQLCPSRTARWSVRASLAMFMAPTRVGGLLSKDPYRYMVHCTSSDLKFGLASELVNGRRGPPGVSGSSDAGTSPAAGAVMLDGPYGDGPWLRP